MSSRNLQYDRTLSHRLKQLDDFLMRAALQNLPVQAQDLVAWKSRKKIHFLGRLQFRQKKSRR